MTRLKTHEEIKAWAQKKVEALKKELEERNPYVLAYDFELVTNCHRLNNNKTEVI
jgi:hypothetical protein